MTIFSAAKRVGAEEIYASFHEDEDPERMNEYTLYQAVEDLGFIFDEPSRSWMKVEMEEEVE